MTNSTNEKTGEKADETNLDVIVHDRDLVFIDTETVALHPEPGRFYVWEIYAERHNTAGTLEIAHLFPEHNPHPTLDMPLTFIKDYQARVPEPAKRTPFQTVGKVYAQLLRQRGDNPPPVVVGANPMFDTHHLAPALTAAGETDGSHFRRIDIEAAAYGHLKAIPRDSAGGLVGLTLLYGLPVIGAHTASGDVQMVKNLYRAIFTRDRADLTPVSQNDPQ